MRPYSLIAVLSAASVALVSAPAAAHPRLVSSQPTEGAQVSRPRAVSLTFSERLVPAMSNFELVMTGMPGMANHDPMKISGFTAQVAPDGKTLRANLPRPLPAGTYELNWSVVAADTHRIKGKINFTVR
jgi:methionine-rich copper-binding protein CopC